MPEMGSFVKMPADIADAVNRANVAIEGLSAELAPNIGKEFPNFNMAGWQDFVLRWRQWYTETTDSFWSMNSGNTYDTAEQYHEQSNHWRAQAFAAGLIKHPEDPVGLPEQKDPIGSDYIKPIMLLAGAYLLVKLIRG